MLLVFILKTRHDSLAGMVGTQLFCHQRDCLAAAHPLSHQFLDPLDSFLLLFMGE
ncbi:hypothetical protein UTI89_C2006 [Escherichia coli UTI89]|uniref:Uncharacterized protein n=1 Tax=Escherichia coli (strain UTI89 / UPEC) TaxID=364106 RepID=Q1RAY2_ECOUT|nr:hypothetical protein UTI89_C2006 [Escherichia coli UTI89]